MFLHLKIPFRIFVCKRLQFFSLVLLIPLLSLAQEKTITGQVKGKNNIPLEGVTVAIKGTTRGTSTSSEGRFTLERVSANAVLIFSSTGFATQEVSIRGKSTIDLTLDDQTANLNEVVVIGYGTAQKKDVTGAVSSLKATRLENENPANVQDMLRGNIAGLSVGTTTTARGGGSFLVRGRSSVTGGTSPLIVVDGVIYPGDLADINPNDINSIDVLKDASSAAVFGAKAASGVILITTKKGTKAKPTITFNTNIGYGELATNEPLYDGPGFVAWRTDVLKSINPANATGKPHMYNDPRELPSNISVAQWKAYDGKQGEPLDIWLDRLRLLPIEVQNYKDGKTIDWYDQMFRKGLRQDHTVSVAGKKEDFSYYMSMGYMNNEGVVVGDKFKTFRFRTNLETKVASFLSVGLNLQFTDRDESSIPVNWGAMINASPYGEKFKADGVSLRDSPNDDIGNNSNPFNDSWFTNRLEKKNTLFGSLYVKGDLPFGFSYQINYTPNYEFYRFFNGVSSKNYLFAARGGVATRIEQSKYHWQLDNLLKWKKDFGDHHVDATFLLNAEKFQSSWSQLSNEGFAPNDNLSYHNIAAGIKPTIYASDTVSTGDALMGRINYSFLQRYMLTASFRRDGYSAFGTKNPRANFPAIAVGWVFSDEKFLQSAQWLSYGKLRASWGINGNRDIGRYAALADLQTGKYQFVQSDGTVVLVSQLYVNRLANPDLKWEETTSYNVGLDFAVLNNRIDGSIDLYHKKTNDLLIDRAMPDVTGFVNVIDNIGQVDNKGIEITLNSTIVRNKNFSWRTSAIFSMNRNKIVHLYGPVPVIDPVTGKTEMIEKDDVANRWFIGKDINAVWDLKVLGVWQESEIAEAAKFGVRPGDFKLEDVNGDGTFSDADRQFLGSTNPKYQWTLRNEFTLFRNFDFAFMIYSIWGHQRAYNQAKNNSGFLDRQNSYKFTYWTPENPTNEYARLFSSNGSAGFSVYREPSFIRLSTISLAYTIPKEILQRAKFESVKIYASVNNMGVYSPNWTFWDPEYGNTPNNERTNAPTPRYYTLGLNVSL